MVSILHNLYQIQNLLLGRHPPFTFLDKMTHSYRDFSASSAVDIMGVHEDTCVVRAEEPTVLGSQEFYELRKTDLYMQFPVDTAIVVPGPIDVERLKHALSRALSRYPLHAGRLEKVADHWRIRLSNAGALLHIRTSQAATPPVGADAPIVQSPFHPLTRPINPWALYSDSERSDEPLLRMTLTLGPAASWSVVGFCASHVVGDGFGMATFMRAVSSLYQNLEPEEDIVYSYPPNPENVQDSEGARIETPWLDRQVPLPSSNGVRVPATTRIDIRLSALQINQIRKGILTLVSSQEDVVPPSLSTQDCLVSALTVAITRVHREHGEVEITRVTNIVNYRGVAPIPRTAACNALIQAVADLPTTSSPSSPSYAYDLASSIRASLQLSRDPAHVRANIAVCGKKFAAAANATPPRALDFSSSSGAVNVNSTRPFDWTLAHFGYEGRARFYHTCTRAPRYIKIFTPNPTLRPDGTWTSHKGAAEVTFYLEHHLRAPFLQVFGRVVQELGVEGAPEYMPLEV